ncbi:MAG: hypothetical protein ACFFB3_11835 [Candidatus Hodarchaeota archaeon]
MKSQIMDLAKDPNLFPCARCPHPSLTEGARETVVNDLKALFSKDLIRSKVLVNTEGIATGVIFYGLVEKSLCNLAGKGILHIFCLDVDQTARHQRNGEKLIQAATNDYPADIVRGISTSSYGEYWMPEDYFRKLNFEVFHQEGLLSHLFKPLAVEVSPPTLLKLQLPPFDAPFVVDHFQGPSYCPFGTSFERRILSIIQGFPNAKIRVHSIQSREDVLRYGTTPSRVFINGQEPADDPTLSEEDLSKAIQALSGVQASKND